MSLPNLFAPQEQEDSAVFFGGFASTLGDLAPGLPEADMSRGGSARRRALRALPTVSDVHFHARGVFFVIFTFDFVLLCS